MKKREILLDYLKSQSGEWFISSPDLAKILGVTDRSIRYYVKQLNEEVPDLIEASREGYRYNQKYQHFVKIDESIDGRRFSILRRLLQNADEGVNLFELADELWVSEATIRQDITVLQEMMRADGLVINQHDFNYYLSGEIEAKRQLIMRVIRKQGGDVLALEEEMQKFLGEIPLTALTEFCQCVFETFNFHPNNYFFQNFILHLIIALNQQKQTSDREFSSPSLPIIEQISGWIFENYSLELFFEDKYELALLCDGERGHALPEVKDYVNKEVAQSLNQALKELSDVFLIDFTDEQFLMRLLLHTQNLYNRVKGKKVKRNLSALDIKVRYPALFDIAVYLSSLIAADLKIEIAEDEIAFLALHLGSFLDEQKKNANKIRTKLKISNYLDRVDRVREILEERFGEELFFVATDKAVSEDGVELILSSEKIVTDEVIETVYIHDFLTERDFVHVRDGIERVKRKQYIQFLRTLLPKLIRKEAYVDDIKLRSKAEIFKFIGQWFFENGFENKDYHQKLLEREKMSATSFSSGVAIPHTIKYEGEKTGLLILNPKDDFGWGEQSIGLVVALAISPNDAQNFNRIFPRMIEILAEKYHVNYLKGSQNRNEFIYRLIEVMTGDGFYE